MAFSIRSFDPHTCYKLFHELEENSRDKEADVADTVMMMMMMMMMPCITITIYGSSAAWRLQISSIQKIVQIVLVYRA
jgi:hypothetical protein